MDDSTRPQRCVTQAVINEGHRLKWDASATKRQHGYRAITHQSKSPQTAHCLVDQQTMSHHFLFPPLQLLLDT